MHTRYVGRKEFFGSLLYDRSVNDYHAFTEDETRLFVQGSLRDPINKYEEERFKTFSSLCRDQQAVDEQGRFLHPWLDNVTQEHTLSAPLKISLNITTGCNLRCRHCYSSSNDEKRRDMRVEHARALVDAMAGLGVQCLSVKGGEPFYHPQFMEILSYARERGISITIITNGLLIDESTARQLNDTSVDYITVSVDGATEGTHDFIRGKGSFSKVLRSIEVLKAHFHKPVFIYYTLNRKNVPEIPRLFSMVRELNCDRLRVRPLLPTGRAAECEDINLTGQKYREALTLIHAQSLQMRVPVDLPHSELVEINENMVLNPGLYSFGCVAGTSFIHMDPGGNVYPCQYLESKEFLAGNMFSQSLKEIWDHSPVLKRFRNLEGNPTCLACQSFPICRGGCRARSLYIAGDINSPEPWCQRGIKAAAEI